MSGALLVHAGVELGAAAAAALALALLWRRREQFEQRTLRLLLGATAATAASGLAFALHADGQGPFGPAGSLLRLAAAGLGVSALVVGATRRPGETPSLGLRQSEERTGLALGVSHAFDREPDPASDTEAGLAEPERRVEGRTVELRASEALNRSLVESSVYGILLVDVEGRVLAANPAAALGGPGDPASPVGSSLWDLVPPEDRPRLELLFRSLLETGGVARFDGRVRGPGGSVVPAEMTGVAVRDPDGTPRAFLASAADISERKRAEEALGEAKETLEQRIDQRTADPSRLSRIHSASRRSDRAMLRTRDEAAFLAEVCQAVVEECGHRLVWIGFAQEGDGSGVRPVAWAGEGEAFVASLAVSWADTERGRGPGGAAIRTGQPVLCRDVGSDPSFAPWRDSALEHGLASLCALPLVGEGRALGVLAIYSALPDAFSPEEVDLLQKMADDLSTGIAAFRLRQALGESEARFRTLAGATFEGIAVAEQGVLVDANERLGEMLGARREELIGSAVADLVVPEDRRRVMETIGLAAETHTEHGMLRRDGRRIAVETHVRSIVLDGRQVRLAAIRDVTESRRSRAELERARDAAEAASRAKSAFLVSLSPELRTPLNAVIGFSEMLEQEHFGTLDGKQREYVRDIAESGRRLLDLLKDILDLARIDAGEVEPDWGLVDVQALLADSLRLVRERCGSQKIRLDLELGPGVWGLHVAADGRRLRWVLSNLLSNAVKLTPDGGSIVVGAQLRDGGSPELEVTVTDSGIGLAGEEQERVLGDLSGVRSGIVGKTPGTGLGLALVRQMVALHGGRVSVESAGVGHGSRFTVVVPVDAGALHPGGPAEGRMEET